MSFGLGRSIDWLMGLVYFFCISKVISAARDEEGRFERMVIPVENVLVTGATSYLGVNLIRRLTEENRSVHVLARPSSDLTRFDGIDPAPSGHRVEPEAESMIQAVMAVRPTATYHIAGYYVSDHKAEDVDRLIESNIRFGTVLLEALAQAGGGNIVNLGSYTQNYDSQNYRPLNLYAATKQAFADVLAYYSDIGAVRAVTLKLFHTYGPGDWRGKLLPAIRDAQRHGRDLPLVAEDETAFDLVYVDDVVDAMIHAASLLADPVTDVIGREFAVSSGKSCSMTELICMFEEIGGAPIETDRGAYPPMKRGIKEPRRGPVLPGWSPKTPLRDGIRLFLDAE